MINKRLLRIMKDEIPIIFYIVLMKAVALLANTWMIYSIAGFLLDVINGRAAAWDIIWKLSVVILLNIFIIMANQRLAGEISARVKEKMRIIIFDKIYSYGMRYSRNFNIAELVQFSVNLIENLEVYFSSFLPQLFYSMLSPIILFIFISRINLTIGLALLAMIPLIPLAIMMVQKLAKRINKNYWGSYVDLSEVFVDFLEGLTTLIIFNADGRYNEKLNKYAEDFRVKTMEVLTMQLNNITALDLLAYGGAVLGILLTIFYYSQSLISLEGAIIIILISSEFFLPLRLLGSFFHIAMNGMGAVDGLFEVLDRPVENLDGGLIEEGETCIEIEDLSFSYNEDREVLKDISMDFNRGELAYIVGKSGSGKSTIASLIMNKLSPDQGLIKYNKCLGPRETEILRLCTMVTNNSYLFKGSLRYNLQMGDASISDERMWELLDKLSLKTYFQGEDGLETMIEEKGGNLSGGQKQRIGIARAILKDSPVLILDEATSNIDSESEDIIMAYLEEIKREKIIIIISHRLKYTPNSDYIYYLDQGRLEERGSFEDLIEKDGAFKNLYDSQMALENWGI